MNLLLLGSGGREHALAWKLAQSPRLSHLYALPGNPGIAQHAELIPGSIADLAHIVAVAKEKAIDLVVVGPEDPLAAGITDHLHAAGIPTFGPSQAAAQLESSKAFSKAFMARHNIPTAEYRTFTNFEEAMDYLDQYPISNTQYPVIKASGLAAGKGVILPQSLEEGERALREIMLEKRFGDAGAEVVIEERLTGREVSILAFSDGKTVVPMLPAQDHKRLLDHDEGPNTGGMGVFAPSPFCPPELIQQAMETAIQPVIDGMRAEGHPFVGVLFVGLMLTERSAGSSLSGGFAKSKTATRTSSKTTPLQVIPKVLEYNCRFGDPETQAVLPLLETDLLDIMLACVNGKLDQIADTIRWKDAASVCVVLASGGYPESYPRGLPIIGLDTLPDNVIAFHAGTKSENGQILTNGGRVLGITAVASTMSKARALAYENVTKIQFDGMHYRNDIAKGF